jgi:hypothetical protein
MRLSGAGVPALSALRGPHPGAQAAKAAYRIWTIAPVGLFRGDFEANSVPP